MLSYSEVAVAAYFYRHTHLCMYMYIRKAAQNKKHLHMSYPGHVAPLVESRSIKCLDLSPQLYYLHVRVCAYSKVHNKKSIQEVEYEVLEYFYYRVKLFLGLADSTDQLNIHSADAQTDTKRRKSGYRHAVVQQKVIICKRAENTRSQASYC